MSDKCRKCGIEGEWLTPVQVTFVVQTECGGKEPHVADSPECLKRQLATLRTELAEARAAAGAQDQGPPAGAMGGQISREYKCGGSIMRFTCPDERLLPEEEFIVTQQEAIADLEAVVDLLAKAWKTANTYGPVDDGSPGSRVARRVLDYFREAASAASDTGGG